MQRESSGRDRCNVLSQNDIRSPEPIEQTVVDHCIGSRAQFLGRLEHQHQPAGKGGPVGGWPSRGSDQTGHVNVMPAGMHHRHLPAEPVYRCRRARIFQLGLLLQRQPVHVRTHQQRRPVAVLQQRDNARPAHPGGDLVPPPAQ